MTAKLNYLDFGPLASIRLAISRSHKFKKLEFMLIQSVQIH